MKFEQFLQMSKTALDRNKHKSHHRRLNANQNKLLPTSKLEIQLEFNDILIQKVPLNGVISAA